MRRTGIATRCRCALARALGATVALTLTPATGRSPARLRTAIGAPRGTALCAAIGATRATTTASLCPLTALATAGRPTRCRALRPAIAALTPSRRTVPRSLAARTEAAALTALGRAPRRRPVATTRTRTVAALGASPARRSVVPRNCATVAVDGERQRLPTIERRFDGRTRDAARNAELFLDRRELVAVHPAPRARP